MQSDMIEKVLIRLNRNWI